MATSTRKHLDHLPYDKSMTKYLLHCLTQNRTTKWSNAKYEDDRMNQLPKLLENKLVPREQLSRLVW
jgi:hypothetical protein